MELKILTGKFADSGATATQRLEAMATAVKSAVYEHGEGMPLATAVGVLEIVKREILGEH